MGGSGSKRGILFNMPRGEDDVIMYGGWGDGDKRAIGIAFCGVLGV